MDLAPQLPCNTHIALRLSISALAKAVASYVVFNIVKFSIQIKILLSAIE